MKVIAFSGWKRSGKDSCAEYLIESYGFFRVALADPLKDAVAKEYGIDRGSLDDPNRKEAPILTMPVKPQDGFSRNLCEFMVKEFRTSRGLQPDGFVYREGNFLGIIGANTVVESHRLVYWTPRALAILKGSVNRSVQSNYWTSKAFEEITHRLKHGQNIVVTDLRYKSEVSQFKEAFGESLITIRVNRFDSSPSSDPSENDLNDHRFDYTLENKGTKEQLYSQLQEIVSKL